MRGAGVGLAVFLLLAGCETSTSALRDAFQNDPEFPPDRTDWDSLELPARAAHARAVHTALGAPERNPVAWSVPEASGVVLAANVVERGPTICRGFTDQIETGAVKAGVRDIACWGDGWFYLRQGAIPPVLGPAFEQEDRVYTVKSGGTLAAVARRTGASVEDLERLNPGHPGRLPRGTRILLP